MRMKCPHCGVSGKADASLSGRKVKCPKCSRLFLVPVVEKVVEAVDTEVEEPLSPVDKNDSVIEDEPAVEEQTTGIEDHPAVDEGSELDDQPGEETDGELDKDDLSYDSGSDSEIVDDDLDPEPELTEELEQDHDEPEYELDFPEEEEPVQELQEVLEESEIPEIEDAFSMETEEENLSEAFGDAAEEHLEEAFEDEDTLPEDLFGEQEADVFPETTDIEKEGLTDRDDDFPDLSDEGIDWEEEQEAKLDGDVEEDDEIAAETIEEELRAELEAMLAGTCSACGRTVDNEETFNEDGRIICADCFSGKEKAENLEMPAEVVSDTDQLLQPQKGSEEKAGKKIPSFSYSGGFSVIRVLKEAWKMTRGIKGAVWGGILVMMLILFGIGGAAVMLPSVGAPAGGTVTAWINILIQLVSTILSMTFTAGLMYMGVRRVAGKSFSWKMIFSGFARIGHVAVAGVLMTLLITSGFLLLILPGIYLAVGYSLTLPLILDKGLGPWDAMETSRRCVHRKWWPVFGTYLLMYPIYFVSCIPLGLGMIWTVPMFIALSGVLYRLLCTEDSE